MPMTTGPPIASARPADAAEQISRIIDTPVALNSEVLRGETRLTRRWGHGALHDYPPGMKGHVVMTFYGAAQQITWRSGASRLASRTRPGSITVIPEGHDGHWDIAGDLEVSHVYLTEQHLQRCSDTLARGKRIELLDRVGFEDGATGHILEMLSQASVIRDLATRLFVDQAIDLLCTQLIRAHSSVASLAPSEPRHGLADWQVKRVTAYMREFMDRDIGLEDLRSSPSTKRLIPAPPTSRCQESEVLRSGTHLLGGPIASLDERSQSAHMTEDPIESVEIREDGRLFVKPTSQNFSLIYRAALEVGWDPAARSLFSPKPREWTYPMWFGQILAAAATEYGVRLSLTPQTQWVNITDDLQLAIADLAQWKGPTA